MEEGHRRGRLIAIIVIVAVVVVAALGVGGVFVYGQSSQAQKNYQAARSRLSGDVRSAAKAGYTEKDLAMPLEHAKRFLNTPTPFWAVSVIGTTYFQHQAGEAQTLDQQLLAQQKLAVKNVSSSLGSQVTAAQAALAHDQQILTPDSVLATYVQQLSTIQSSAQREQSSPDIKSLHTLTKQGETLVVDLKKTGTQQTQVNSTIQTAANTLLAQAGSNVATLQSDGNAATSNGRNDASVAAYEALPGRFPKINQMMDLDNRLEYYVPKLGTGTAAQISFAAAAIQYYSNQIHSLLMANLGPQHIIVNWTQQHIYIYQNGQLVQSSPVTTGVRGVTSVGTDFGPMKVLYKGHPWTMKSPWPKGSPYWYPDTTVQYATFFTDTGESIHDAYWEPDSSLGPGSQNDPAFESHGCVHVPLSLSQWVYNWSNMGTPVDVYPGDGTPVAQQLSLITTNNQGVPQGSGTPSSGAVPEG
ncbi:MAG TPA: L,D-transpeptidase [Candidatus Dormibacteraeota bacterium]|jgi:lipoprotein-anchoring transpeptidase ErfK/SrfK|nr:L,D-transpeptidase [Candidatus Dormibacteraeota bacterium]